MRKLSTKLLISVLSAVLALTALGTSTFAWFSMNKEVEATGMQITAKSDAPNLLIGESSTISAGQTVLNFTGSTALYPVTNSGAAVGTKIGSTGGWYYTYSDTESSAERGSGAQWNKVTNTSEYVLKKTFYFNLSSSQDKELKNLRVDSIDFDGTDAGVKVMIVKYDGTILLIESGDYTNTAGTGAIIAESLSYLATANIYCEVYIFFEGNDADVTTNNYNDGNLHGSIDISFIADQPTE